ncbi:hypothetical protein BHM03_00054545 [Ensete ventricosum]|nr:hypothetical protein BHM03_00054545 [Ensete ventricosum]
MRFLVLLLEDEVSPRSRAGSRGVALFPCGEMHGTVRWLAVRVPVSFRTGTGKDPYRPVRTGPVADLYMDRPLSGDLYTDRPLLGGIVDLALYRTIRGRFRSSPLVTEWYQPSCGLAAARGGGRRIGRTLTRLDPVPPSFDDPNPVGNGETAARPLLRRVLRRRSEMSAGFNVFVECCI